MSERYAVLGAAPARTSWFHDVARWSTTAAVPVDFSKAVSTAEVRARLRGGRRYSAVLLDAALPGLDRDLLELARERGAAPVVVTSDAGAERWRPLGAAEVAAATLDRDGLLALLGDVATPVHRLSSDAAAGVGPAPTREHPATDELSWRGALVAVTGAAGTGRSTLAIALAQGLARDARYADVTCLADLALHADHAVLHDATDVVPGVVELVEAHRSGAPAPDVVRQLTWEVADHGYHLLLGLRRHRDWTSIRPRAFAAALDGLRRSFRVVVADVDADLEDEAACGSADVEERNTMARTTVAAADLVVAVGTPGLGGLHRLLRTVRDLLDHGVPGERLLPVLNRAPRQARVRGELRRTFGQLLAAERTGVDVPTPVFVPERRRLDVALRDGRRVPAPIVHAATAPVVRLLGRVAEPVGPEADAGRSGSDVRPELVAPGSLGTWGGVRGAHP